MQNKRVHIEYLKNIPQTQKCVVAKICPTQNIILKNNKLIHS